MAAYDALPADCITTHLGVHVAQHDDKVVGRDARQCQFQLLVEAILVHIRRWVCGGICDHDGGADGTSKV